MAVDFTFDRGFERELLTSAGVRELVKGKADAVRDVARDNAPDDPTTSAPDLKSGIISEAVLTPRGWVGRVVGTDWKTGFYEFGTVRIPARRMIANALEQEVGPLDSAPE